jgi:hypothetical protein
MRPKFNEYCILNLSYILTKQHREIKKAHNIKKEFEFILND